MSDLNMEKLEAIFWGDQREQPTRVRLERVVKALRDESYACDHGDEWLKMLDEILGDAGNEKVAEAPDLPTRTVQLTGITKSARPDVQFEPATDPCPRCGHPAQDQCDNHDCNTVPAPAVCEWTESKWTLGYYVTPHGVCRLPGKHCPSCGKPIKFTEVKT